MIKTKQSGSSLIEVLVTLVIMAVGLLGLASMQMISIKNINNSQFRSLATDYAYDMAERMRANSSGDYDGLDTSDLDVSTNSDCDSYTDMVDLDKCQWAVLLSQDVISGGLPSGSGTVTEDSGVYDITITWDEQGRDSDGGTIESTNFTLSVQL